MFNSSKQKRLWYWVIILLLVSIIPISIFLFSDNLKNIANYSKNKSLSSYTVPKLKQQPKDTIVSDKIIPLHRWRSKGVQVVFVPTENLPIIDIDVSFKAGSSRDNNLFGIANITSELLDQGTKNLPNDPDTIAQTFENAGAEFSTSVGRDRASIELRTLANIKELDDVLNLYTDVISKPTFDFDAIERLKEQTLVRIRFNKQVPEKIVSSEFIKALYKSHPYGHDKIGEEETVKAINKKAIEDFYNQYYVAKNASITIVGGIHRDKAKEIADKIIESLPEGSAAKALPVPENVTTKVVRTINRPGNQSQIFMGRLATTINDSDNYAIELGNHVLGAPFTSRLFKKIRIEGGLSYNVGSSLAPMMQKGVYIANLQTKTETTKKALELLKDIINNFEKNGPTDKELIAAKKHLIGSMSFWFESNSKTLGVVSMLNFYGMPLNYFDTYQENIEKVTLNDIKNIFNDKLNFKNSVQVVLSEKF